MAYGLLGQADTEPMASLLAETFSRGEPMAVAVGLPREEIFRLVSGLIPKALAERLSVVARDVSTGRLLGALLADDFGTPPTPGLEHLAPHFAPVGALLDGLDERYRGFTEVAPGTHVHIYMVGVSEGSSSRGIARRLVEACLSNASGLRYHTAVTEATGGASQHVFRKLGFQERLSASYREFLFDGRPVFSGIQGVAGTLLMTRALHDGLQVQEKPAAP